MPSDSQHPVQPKRASAAANAWILYRKDVMPALRQLHEDAGLPALPQSEYSKVVSRLWHSASEAERSVYRERAKRMRDEEMAQTNLNLEVNARAPGIVPPTLMPMDTAWYGNSLSPSPVSSSASSSMSTTPAQGNFSPPVFNTAPSTPYPQVSMEENIGSYFTLARQKTWANSTTPSLCLNQLHIEDNLCAELDGSGFAVETQPFAQSIIGHVDDFQELPLTGAQFHGLSPSMSYHTPSLSLDDADRSPASQASHTLLGDDLPSMDHGCDTTLTSPVQGDFSYTPVYATPGASVQAQTSAPYYGVTPTFDIVPSNANAGALIFEPHVSLEQELASFASPDMSCLSQPQELDGQGFFDSAVSSASPPATLGPMLSLLLADDVDPSLEWYPSNGQDLRSTLSLPSPAPYNAPTPEDFSPGTYNDWTIYDIDSFTPSTDITQSPASANDVWSDGENSAAVLYDEHVDHSFESSEYPADWTQRWSQA